MSVNRIPSYLAIGALICTLCLSFMSSTPYSSQSPKPGKGIIIKDARGLGIPLGAIKQAASEKSVDQLVILTFAEQDDSSYVDLVYHLSMGQYHLGHENLFLLVYDLPKGTTDGMTVLYFKGDMTLPVTYRADRSGASLATLIRRVYNDHYMTKSSLD